MSQVATGPHSTAGRYVIFFMALFSLFTGLIYNEAFSIPLALFGTTHYKCPTDHRVSLINIRTNEVHFLSRHALDAVNTDTQCRVTDALPRVYRGTQSKAPAAILNGDCRMMPLAIDCSASQDSSHTL